MGGTPIAGWFLAWKIPLRWMIVGFFSHGGTPKSSILDWDVA